MTFDRFLTDLGVLLEVLWGPLDLMFVFLGGLIFDHFFEPLQTPLLIDVGSVVATILLHFRCFLENGRKHQNRVPAAAGTRF